MSIKLMTAVWQHAAVDGRRLLLLLALADNCSDEGMCYPSVKYLAQKTRQSERNVQYALRYLEENGWIKISPDESGFTRYFLNTSFIPGGGANFAPGGAKAGKNSARLCTRGVQGLVKTASPPIIEPSLEPSLEPFTLQPPSEVSGNGNSNSSKPKKDERHPQFQKILVKFYFWLNEKEYYWTARDAGALGRFLKENPKLDSKEFSQWLRNYADTEEINDVLHPFEFLPRLHRCANGPLDKYGKPRKEEKRAAF